MTTPMTGAELLTISEGLGLNLRDLATVLGVAERTVSRWYDEQVAVPDGVRADVARIEAITTGQVATAVDSLTYVTEPVVYVHRTSEQFLAARPELRPYPARWWRVVAYRAVSQVPGARIEYATS